jgi:hypothetical protein
MIAVNSAFGARMSRAVDAHAGPRNCGGDVDDCRAEPRTVRVQRRVAARQIVSRSLNVDPAVLKNDRLQSRQPAFYIRVRLPLNGFLITFFIGVAATATWQRHGDAAIEMLASFVPAASLVEIASRTDCAESFRQRSRLSRQPQHRPLPINSSEAV